MASRLACTLVVLCAAWIVAGFNADAAASVSFPFTPQQLVSMASYFNVSRDVCDIKAAAARADYSDAILIYAVGRNSASRNGGFRTAKGVATRVYAEPWYAQYAEYYKQSPFLDAWWGPALEGKYPYATCPICPEVRRVSVQAYAQVYPFFFMMHEVDAGGNGLADTTLTEAERRADAAIETTDAAAIYVGGANTTGECPLSAVAQRLGAEFCTPDNDGLIVQALINARNTANNAPIAVAYDRFFEKRNVVLDRLSYVFAQQTLSYVKRADNRRNKRKGCETRALQAGALASFRAIAPRLAAKSPGPVKKILSLLDFEISPAPKNLYEKVSAQLRLAVGDKKYRKFINAC